jgi:uncharacterized membrane protein
LIYLSIESVTPALFSVLFAGLAVIKFISTSERDISSYVVLAFGIVFSLALALTDSEFLLRLYPVAMSFTFAALFAVSLSKEESLIEQFARISGKTITPNAKKYTRRLSGIWCILLVGNGLVALYLAISAPLKTWALYCGLISYVILGGFFLAELGYRQFHIKRYGA